MSPLPKKPYPAHPTHFAGPFWNADQMDAHATAAYSEGRADERAEWEPVLGALRDAEALIAGDLVGPEWKQACHEFLRAARTAIARVTEG